MSRKINCKYLKYYEDYELVPYIKFCGHPDIKISKGWVGNKKCKAQFGNKCVYIEGIPRPDIGKIIPPPKSCN